MKAGLDRLLAAVSDGSLLPGRLGRYALLGHGASLTDDLVPAHLALAASSADRPALLLGPEHGYYGVEQDMVPAEGRIDPWTGAPIASLYGDSEETLRPDPALFEEVDLLLVDVQDVGARYYTYAATAVWAAEAALAAGREVWILDRPNPLGGERIEGNLLEPGYESFVGAFRTPVRHGLTVGELVRLEARRRGWGGGVTVWRVEGWRRGDRWPAPGRPWIAASPNMPTVHTVEVYPGGCLVEATTVSEGRGTTRPFHLVGAPGYDPRALAGTLDRTLRELHGGDPGLRAIPTFFRPQFQKHAGERCAGVELVVTDPQRLRPVAAGVLLLAALVEEGSARGPSGSSAFGWRSEPYELVHDRPAVDLLAGCDELRLALEGGRVDRGRLERWIASWTEDEAAFAEERRPALLYPGHRPGEEAGSSDPAMGAVR